MIANFYPLDFPMESFQIGRLPYSKTRLDALREAYNKENSFFSRDEHIYVSPMGGRSVPDTQTVTLDLAQSPQVVGSLVRHIFFRAFKDAHPEVVPLDFYPFRILSRNRDHDILASALQKLGITNTSLGSVLAKKKLIEVQFRETVLQGKWTLGAVINVRYVWTFGAGISCASLAQEGFELVGRDVLLVEPLSGFDGVLKPDETRIGSVVASSGDFATVKTNEGLVSHPLAQLLPERSYKNIDDLLAHYLGGGQVEAVRAAIKELDTTRLNAKSYQWEVAHMASVISKLEYRNKDNFTFRILPKPIVPGKGFNLQDPKFRFDYGPGASGSNASYGLLQHGPYDSLTFRPKSPRIAVLCHRSSRDAFTSFLGKLRDGIPEASNFPGGMRGKYRLQDITFDAAKDLIEVDRFTAEEYERAAARYLSTYEREQRADLVLIQTQDEFKEFAPGQNPYYRAKARFMMAGIPTQFLKAQTIRKPDQNLRYTIDSVALQAYAKMGGVPYVLPAGNNVDREIVVGIGSALNRSNTYSGNEQNRVVGITTFFKADGEYLFGTRCREVPFEEYFDALLDNLRTSLDEVASGYGWREGDAVRLVFHVFKPMKDVEAEVVARLVKEYPQYAITFAFVTVTDRHPFILFDLEQKGRYVRGDVVGEFVPKRRVNWVLDDLSCLIQLSGIDEMSTASHGFSTPVLVRIHEGSTFHDLHAIAQQVFNFTFLSWRSFKSSRIPVTIDYANQISRMLTNLRKVDGWRPEAVNDPGLRRKKWFL